MKLGVFDSGLGGVLITRAIRDAIPDIDIVYYGDTLHVPYGNRSADAIYEYTRAGMEFLFKEQDCALIIVACNTASVSALRRLQQKYLIENYPDRRILGVVVPTIEEAIDRGYQNIGLIGTNYTVSSGVYEEELQKINPDISFHSIRTPLLVPMIEHEGERWIDDILDHYLAPMKERSIDALLLGCTHYVHVKKRIRARYDFDVLSQDEVIPLKLQLYFKNHAEIIDKINKNRNTEFYVSDIANGYQDNVSRLFGRDVKLQKSEGN